MEKKSAIIVADVQNDFCPGGALPVPDGDKVVDVLNRYMQIFSSKGIPIFITRDWHPEKTNHFKEYGGLWPAHCVKGTHGAQFHKKLKMFSGTTILTKGDRADRDDYSAFYAYTPDVTPFSDVLMRLGIKHLYIGGLATDYCVRETVLDALKRGFSVTVLLDAVKGVDINPGDSEKALQEMKEMGADTTTIDKVS